MCIGMCADIDMCIGICIDMYVDVRIGHVYRHACRHAAPSSYIAMAYTVIAASLLVYTYSL